jgi:hypothetical protein
MKNIKHWLLYRKGDLLIIAVLLFIIIGSILKRFNK